MAETPPTPPSVAVSDNTSPLQTPTLPFVGTPASDSPSSSAGLLAVPIPRPWSQVTGGSNSGSIPSSSRPSSTAAYPQPRPMQHRFPSFRPVSMADSFQTTTSWMPPKQLSQYAMDPDPNQWSTDVSPATKEEDDELHKPDPNNAHDLQPWLWSKRAFFTAGGLALLLLGIMMLFLGYPVIYAMVHHAMSKNGGFGLGGINATGQVFQGRVALIDKDTPEDAMTKPSYHDSGRTMQLVFSDEFNVDGRSFYPGDDPFWEAADLWYWGTRNLEWYDPQQVTTRDGNLVITLDQVRNHDLDFMGGMIQTWNKFCFTGGLIESRVSLPGQYDVSGLWPAIWTMGNLGRAGYGATVEGLWPYSYEACDGGTLANQTLDGVPDAQADEFGDWAYDYSLSYLPGQRLSACTCPGEDHPGPQYRDGTYKARSAPEIDIFEAQVTDGLLGSVSQSCQFAPFNAWYSWDNVTGAEIVDETISILNGFKGNPTQQAASVVTQTNHDCYTQNLGCFSIYGFEYKPGYEDDNAYVTWINDDKVAWTLYARGMGADTVSRISERVIPKEPMYAIINLGISPGFGEIDLTRLIFPTEMHVDYIRVYQFEDEIDIGCDPPGYPTNNYISKHIEAYTNANLTVWGGTRDEGGYEQPMPRNSLIDQC